MSTKLLFSHLFLRMGRALRRSLLLLPLLGILSFLLLLLGGSVPEGSVGLNNGLTALFFALVLLFFLLLLFAEIRICHLYYRTLLGEEASFYLSFPVTLDAQITARLLFGVLWQALLLLVAAFTVVLGMLLPFELLLREENVSYLSFVVRSFFDAFSPLLPLVLLLAPSALMLLCFAALTVGTLFFERKRVLGLILSLGLSLLLALSLYTGAGLFAEAFLPDALLHLPSLLVSLALSVLAILCIRHSLKKRTVKM